MGESLRDQLLKSGLAKPAAETKARPAAPRGPRPGASTGNSGKPGKPSATPGKRPDNGEIDLAKAYAIRAQAEANERRRAEQAAAEQARLKRERKQKIQSLLQGKALNKADVDQVRHFEYGGKIRRVHVDSDQLAAINQGQLGVVQSGGRYLLVERTVAEQVHAIEPALLALLVDPDAPAAAGDDGVPDDLMW